MLNVLVVDDEPDLCGLIADELIGAGHTVDCASDGREALAKAAATTFDLVLTDMRLPGLDGLTLFRRLREQSPSTDMILMTGNAAVSDAVAVLKEGAFDYLIKPIQVEELGAQLARLATYRELHRDVTTTRAELADGQSSRERLIGRSPLMMQLLKRLDAIAHSDAAVVITGESGTGKELVARALHSEGERRKGPFVAVNCAAFPDTLIEAELFGHERGAFTGATSRREGRFKAAHGGTLFLDEVAELSPAAQAKLLRVLQEGTIEPLGSDASIKVDVRIISATHRDLKQRIAAGLFREDLYYRINTLDLAIPPLRERPGDLVVLVNLFIQRFSDRRKPTTGISWRAWNALSAHPFPGNVRELMHTIEHAVLLSAGGQIDLEHLPVTIRGGQADAPALPEVQMVPLGAAIKEFERSYLVHALSQFDGQKVKTAESLGISRKNLWEKLRAHGISDASA
ncbi:MAG TPA: sigma-54 dependent transcriptional regulator [Polyangia bacterium]|nr:sigma-54 dependent transcriptional regulator [Polyangia bacterium]